MFSNVCNLLKFQTLQNFIINTLIQGPIHWQHPHKSKLNRTDGETNIDKYEVWVIPQETVDNNLGPDRLAGPKALDLNYCRQPTLWLHDYCLEFLTEHGIKLCLYRAKAFSIIILLMSCIWHRSNRYNF